MTRGIAVVTGASSGIGEATARRLAAEGYDVVAAARRRARLDALAEAVPGIRPMTLDVTDPVSVDALAHAIGGCSVLVNNAGGALGVERVADADEEHWQWMYDANVLGSLRMTKALLPQLVATGNGVIVNITSIAGHIAYEGGAGYNAAKYAQRAMTEALRLELCGKPVRITEIAPGMVHTEEFSLVRLGGDRDQAEAVYRGVPGPLVAEDVADAIAWVVTRPAHVNIDLLVIKPRAQAAPYKIHRESTA